MNTVATVVVLDKDIKDGLLKVKVSIQEGTVTLGDVLYIIGEQDNFTKGIEKILANGSKRTYVEASESVECVLYLTKDGASRIKKNVPIKVRKGLMSPGYNTTQFRVAKSPI